MADLGEMRVKVGADISMLKQEMDAGKKTVRDFSDKSATSIKTVSASLSSLDDIIAGVTSKLNQNLDAKVFTALEKSAADLDQRLSGLNKEAAVTSNTFSKLSSNLSPTSKILADTAIKSSKLDSTLAKGKGANEATFALTNLGRVAQDLPYGFIGIQNNLNPLLESFQRLKAESGSTGGALKALIGSLKGAGGVGLALSLVTAAVSFATIGFDMWTRGMKKTDKGLDETAQSAKDAADAFKNIVGSAAKEAADVAGLVAILKSENETRERKVSALKEIKKINPEIFEGLKLEGNAVVGVDNAYKAYLVSLKTVISAKILQSQLESKITQLLKLQGIEQSTLVKNITNGLDSLLKKQGAPLVLTRMQQESAKTSKATNLLTSDIEDLQKRLTELSKGVSVPELKEPKIKKEKTKKDVETISDVLAKMNAQIDVLNKKEILGNISLSAEKIKVFEKTIDDLFTKFKLETNNPHIVSIEARINDIQLRDEFKKVLKGKDDKFQVPVEVDPVVEILPTSFDEVRDGLIRDLKRLGVSKTKIGVPIETANLKELKDTLDETENKLETISRITTDALSPAFDALFNSILSGSQNAFQALGEALRQTVVQLSVTILKAAALAAILSAITPGGSFTSIFKKLLGFSEGGHVKGFATGGYISGPGTKTSDSIFARLSRGEYVIQASTVDRFGVGFFDKLNKGMMPKFDSFGFAKFAQGGFVSPNMIRTAQVPALSGVNIGGGQSIQIHGNFELRNDRLVAAVSRGTAQINRNS